MKNTLFSGRLDGKNMREACFSKKMVRLHTLDKLVFASTTFSAPYMLPEAGISCQSKLRFLGIVAIGNEGPEMTDESNRAWSS